MVISIRGIRDASSPRDLPVACAVATWVQICVHVSAARVCLVAPYWTLLSQNGLYGHTLPQRKGAEGDSRSPTRRISAFTADSRPHGEAGCTRGRRRQGPHRPSWCLCDSAGRGAEADTRELKPQPRSLACSLVHLTLISWVTVGESLNFSELQTPHLKTDNNITQNRGSLACCRPSKVFSLFSRLAVP